VHEGRPNAGDLIMAGQVHLMINTPLGKLTQRDDYAIRRIALLHRVPYTTTMSAANASCDAVIALRNRKGSVRCLQEWYQIRAEREGATKAAVPHGESSGRSL
jgi:carbamoyl-phosphate synthase large subunit